MPSDFDVKRDSRLQERLAKEVAVLVKQPGNSACADCGATRTVRFVSVTLGTFICNRCYGLHRSIGAHVTRGKCIGLDAWLPAEVDKLRTVGNANAKQIFEAAVPQSVSPPAAESSDKEVEKWIRNKYEHRAYMLKEEGTAAAPDVASTAAAHAAPGKLTINLPDKAERISGSSRRPSSDYALPSPKATGSAGGLRSPSSCAVGASFAPAASTPLASPSASPAQLPPSFAATFDDFDIGVTAPAPTDGFGSFESAFVGGSALPSGTTPSTVSESTAFGGFESSAPPPAVPPPAAPPPIEFGGFAAAAPPVQVVEFGGFAAAPPSPGGDPGRFAASTDFDPMGASAGQEAPGLEKQKSDVDEMLEVRWSVGWSVGW